MALYAFDGTWNRRDAKSAIDASKRVFRRDTEETNVHRFGEFFGRDRTEYLEGVGTRFRRLGAAIGGTFGVGGRYRLRRMYLALCKRYHGSDKHIDVVGFSRGAALAIHFTNVIERYGVPDPRGPRHFGWHYYDGLGLTFRFPKLPAKPPPEPVPIRFLGLWDTVATFGVPVGPFRNSSSRWWVKRLPKNVVNSFHAMALDEVRATFELVRPEEAFKDQQYEVWFRGAHSNVGGSYPDRGLSDIALAWMMEMYLWTLDFNRSDCPPPGDFIHALRMICPERLPAPESWIGTSLEELLPDPDGELGLPLALDRAKWRLLPPCAKVHHSAYQRTPNLVLDHYRSNRRLLRRIPPDAEPTYDPPLFYSDTPEQAATRVARAAFGNIPVRAAHWCTVQDAWPVRSDEWWAPAPKLDTQRNDLVVNFSKASFVAIATAWLQAGKPDVAELRLPDELKLTDYDGDEVDRQVAVEWTVGVLKFLEMHVPALRDYRPYPPPQAANVPRESEAPVPDDRRRRHRQD
jgi:type VI secretion system (T6SS) phospholipase Tle1-like effector